MENEDEYKKRKAQEKEREKKVQDWLDLERTRRGMFWCHVCGILVPVYTMSTIYDKLRPELICKDCKEKLDKALGDDK